MLSTIRHLLPAMFNAPRIEFSYTIFWTKHVRTWSAERRAAVQAALQPVLAHPNFEKNAYERRYFVPGLDDSKHSGESLVVLQKVLVAFDSLSTG